MIPVEGEWNARTQRSSGSIRRASSPLTHSRLSTPLPSAFFTMASSDFASRSSQATVSLPRRLIRHAMLGAIGIEHVAALDAEARLQTAVGIMQPGMDDFAVARRGLGAELARRFENQYFMPGARQRARHGEADDARPDHDAFDGIAHRGNSTASDGRAKPAQGDDDWKPRKSGRGRARIRFPLDGRRRRELRRHRLVGVLVLKPRGFLHRIEHSLLRLFVLAIIEQPVDEVLVEGLRFRRLADSPPSECRRRILRRRPRAKCPARRR